MELDRVRGQPGAVRFLKGLLGSERFPQAMLFSGPAGVGKRTAAVAFGWDSLCVRGGAPSRAAASRKGACGECDSCRLLSAGTHPDMVVVGTDRSKKQIVLDDVRGLAAFLSLKPLFERKCAVLVDSERMNTFAQNSLLKALEEPPPSAVFVPTSANPEALLETVRSRCAAVRFGRLRADALRALGVEDEEAASSGSVRAARAILDGRELAAHAQEICSPGRAAGAERVLRSADLFAEAARKAGALEAATALLHAGRETLARSPGGPAAQEALAEIVRAAKALLSNVRVELVTRCLAWKLKKILAQKTSPN